MTRMQFAGYVMNCLGGVFGGQGFSSSVGGTLENFQPERGPSDLVDASRVGVAQATERERESSHFGSRGEPWQLAVSAG